MGVARERLAGAGGETSRRPEMREPKRALNLPMIIGQNPTVPVAKSGPTRLRPANGGDRTVRFPVVMAGGRVSLGSAYSTASFATMSTLP
jgi:hypothetical protein